jgi:hypothetical protein
MVTKMQKYVIPPTFDFVTNPDSVVPIAMLIFEFESDLSQKDLRNIWQNLPPDDTAGGKISISQATIPSSREMAFPLLKKGDPNVDIDPTVEGIQTADEKPHGGMFSDYITPLGFPDDVQWLVFKVKQKAKTNYFDITAKNESLKGATIGAPWQKQIQSQIPDYSYNWPYDFFSMVELVRLESTYKLEPGAFAVRLEGDPDPVEDPNFDDAIDKDDRDTPHDDPDDRGPSPDEIESINDRPAPDDDPVDWPRSGGRAGGGTWPPAAPGRGPGAGGRGGGSDPYGR